MGAPRWVQGNMYIKELLKTQLKVSRQLSSIARMHVAMLSPNCDTRKLQLVDRVLHGDRRPGVYPEVDLSQIINRETTTHIVDMPTEAFTVTAIELLAICSLTQQLRPKLAYEFGTGDGRTTRNIALNLPPGGRVITVNIPQEQSIISSIGSRFRLTPEEQSITQLWANTKEMSLEEYISACQFVFVDADHKYDSVIKDSESALRLIDKEYGVILWHDALRFGVQRALPEIAAAGSLPIFLIAETNLAMLCYRNGVAVTPIEWSQRHRSEKRCVVGDK